MEDHRLNLSCPISLELLEDPISTPCCGQALSRASMKAHLLIEETCPLCRSDLRKEFPSFNIESTPMNRTIASLVEAQKQRDANGYNASLVPSAPPAELDCATSSSSAGATLGAEAHMNYPVFPEPVQGILEPSAPEVRPNYFQSSVSRALAPATDNEWSAFDPALGREFEAGRLVPGHRAPRNHLEGGVLFLQLNKQKVSTEARREDRRARRSQRRAQRRELEFAVPSPIGGSWLVPKRIWCSNILSSSALDFRRAYFVYPETTVYANQVLGGFHMTVPRGVQVDCHGLGLLGSFHDNPDAKTPVGTEGPVIRVVGVSVLAGAHVHVDDTVPAIRFLSQ